MRPGEILDAQIELLERVEHNPKFAETIAFLAAHHYGNVTVTERRDLIDDKMQAMWDKAVVEYKNAPRMLASHLKVGYAYRVTHDMCQMVEWMASQLENDDKFFKALLPTEAGIVCFDKPLKLHDVRGKTMLVHWLVWGPGQTVDRFTGRTETGTVTWEFNDTWREPDDVTRHFADEISTERGVDAWDAYLRMTGRWATVGTSLIPDQTEMGPLMWEPSEKQRLQIAKEGFEAVQGTNAVRHFQALILLLNQSVTTVQDEEVDRASRRRATKKGIPPKVSVIKLRRSEGEAYREPGESAVEWSHRWIVRRHWRWQPYGSRRHNHEHAYGPIEPMNGFLSRHCTVEGCDHHLDRIIINPYEKGPADKPLVVTEKVYSLER